MERHTCNRCFRRFPNGRALCGHMRSHVADSGESADEEHDGAGDKGSAAPIYVLRENPRKSFRLVDPEFSSSIAAANAASSLVQDGESETESPRAAAPKRRRSKRRRRAVWTPEPASSVSDATPEEDVAISLMMLSRDAWASMPDKQLSNGSDYEEDDRIAVGSDRPSRRQKRTRYRCETCEKSFTSYQALGGHRASHKKLKIQIDGSDLAETNAGLRGAGSSKVHKCPVCFRVFPSGQALGGHKRSHFAAAAAAIGGVSTTAAHSKCEVSLIDLNMPAPIDEESAEVSVVSDEEFVHPTNIGFRPTH